MTFWSAATTSNDTVTLKAVESDNSLQSSPAQASGLALLLDYGDVASPPGPTSAVLYGGNTGFSFVDQTWLCSLDPSGFFCWVIDTGSQVPAQVAAPATSLVGTTLYALGGVSLAGTPATSCWTLDIRTAGTQAARWDAVSCRLDDAAFECFGCTLTAIDAGFILLVGNNRVGSPHSTIFDGQLQLLSQNFQQPTPRFGHSAVLVPTMGSTPPLAVVFGGWSDLDDWDLEHGKAYDDLWICTPVLPLNCSWLRYPAPTHSNGSVLWPSARAFHLAGTVFNPALGRHVIVMTGGYVAGQKGPQLAIPVCGYLTPPVKRGWCRRRKLAFLCLTWLLPQSYQTGCSCWSTAE